LFTVTPSKIWLTGAARSAARERMETATTSAGIDFMVS
jgi:hypothetical protein